MEEKSQHTITPTSRRTNDECPADRKRTSAPEAKGHAGQEVRVDMKRMEAEAGGVASEQRKKQQQQKQFKVSPHRWRILLGISLLGICNGFSNESSPILNVYTSALDMRLDHYVYMAQMFFFVPWIAGFASATLVDRGGVKVAVHTSLLFVSLRNSARALLFATDTPGWHKLRWLYWATQNLVTTLTVSLYYTLPLRVAESWFSEAERSLALSMMLGAPALGTAGAALVYPYLVPDLEHASILTELNLILAASTIIFVSSCVQRSKPREGPPSARNQKNVAELSEQRSESWAEPFKKLLANKQYLLQVIVLSCVDPLLWSVQGISQDIFKSAHMSSLFCGQYLALSNVVGAGMQILCSYLWKAKSRRRGRQLMEEQKGVSSGGTTRRSQTERDPFRTAKCKWLASIQSGLFIIHCYSLVIHELHSNQLLLESQWWLVIVSSVSFISVRSWAAPYYNEQAAELICGSVSEPLSGACSMFFCCLMVNLFNTIFIRLRQEQPLAPQHSSGAGGGPPMQDIYKWSVLFDVSVSFTTVLVYVLKFAPNKQKQQAQVVQLELEQPTREAKSERDN